MYEESCDGHVRERYGAMVGPDEEELIESDDSDKVRDVSCVVLKVQGEVAVARVLLAISYV